MFKNYMANKSDPKSAPDAGKTPSQKELERVYDYLFTKETLSTLTQPSKHNPD